MRPGFRWWFVFGATILVLIAILAVPVTLVRLYGFNAETMKPVGFVVGWGPRILAALIAVLIYESFRVGRRLAFNVCALIVACSIVFAVERQANIDACDSIHGASSGSFDQTLSFILEEMLPPEMLRPYHRAATCDFVL